MCGSSQRSSAALYRLALVADEPLAVHVRSCSRAPRQDREIPVPARRPRKHRGPFGLHEVTGNDHEVVDVPRILVGVESKLPESTGKWQIWKRSDSSRSHWGRRLAGVTIRTDPLPGEGQLLDVEARHDRLASARIIGKEEAKSEARRRKSAVDRLELVWKRLDVRNRQRGHVMLEADLDPVGFYAEPKPFRISVEPQIA